jgi:hypothetical protein
MRIVGGDGATLMLRRCIVCGALYVSGRQYTCSDVCHDELVEQIVKQLGEYKKIIRVSTGIAYRVPTRDIIENGVREQDLDKYPVWTDE